jgi:hypothetical protein
VPEYGYVEVGHAQGSVVMCRSRRPRQIEQITTLLTDIPTGRGPSAS